MSSTCLNGCFVGMKACLQLLKGFSSVRRGRGDRESMFLFSFLNVW